MTGIHHLGGVDCNDLYTTDGKDVWRVISMCERPTITLKNVETGEETGGAVGCPNVAEFKRLIPQESEPCGE